MGVDDVTFLVDRMGEDCAPRQEIRELTQNGIEAVLALPRGQGEIVWDLDWNRYDLDGTRKLAIIDTGIGMTGEEMVGYINNLSASIHVQSRTGNYGVGAKIAAAPRNHRGLVYLSWKDGRGYMVHLHRDPDSDEYGLMGFEHPDGRTELWLPIDDTLKPPQIEDQGTMVILLGMTADADTMAAPEGSALPSSWVARYLNSRYFRFPEGVTVKAREGWDLPRDDDHNFLRTVTGMEPWLDRNCEASGSVSLEKATGRWWILSEEADRDPGRYTPNGHTAALYQDELHEVAMRRSATAKLQSFGIIFGHRRVVIYVEPSGEGLTTNTARTNLILDGEPLPWDRWAADFRERLPDALKQLVESAGEKAAATDHEEAIRERLNEVRDLYRISRFRPHASGPVEMADETMPGGTSRRIDRQRGDRPAHSGGNGGRVGDIYSLFVAEGGLPAEEITTDSHPKVEWLSVTNGTRSPPDMEDRAAKYLAELNRLQINADFRVFTDMVDRWSDRMKDVPGAASVVEDVVRMEFELRLVEAVLGAQALRFSTQWTGDDLRALWTEEALTAAVLPRYHIDKAIRRALGHRLGARRGQAA